MSCKIPLEVQQYIDIVESGELNTCNEQKQLCKLVKKVFETENLKVDYQQIEKYMSYQKYFPFELFAEIRIGETLENTLIMKNTGNTPCSRS